MKIKIFNRALFTMLSVMVAVGAYAQQSGSASAVTVTTVPAVPSVARVYSLQPFTSLDGQLFSYDLAPQDSAYRKEMKKLQDQVRDLQKKMSDLRSEEMKKNAAAMQERTKKLTDESFKKLESFKNFSYRSEDNVSGQTKGLGVVSTNGNSVYYGGGKGDDYLKSKIESGEVKEKTKSYSKSYNVDRDDKIAIDNKFGKITINTWTKNEVKVDVQIKVDADDDDQAQKLLDHVSISDSKDDSAVSFKTNIEPTNDDNNNFMGVSISSGKTHVRKIEVNYVVYMPAKSPLTINNKFGSVKVPDLSGKLDLTVSYGNLTAQQLTNPLNDITVKFGDANIETLNSNSIAISYGKLIIGTADNLKAKLSFSTASIDRLKSAGDISIKYGDGFKVGQLDKNVKNLNIDATFTKVLLNSKDDFDFDVTTKMGNFSYDNDGLVNVTSKTPSDNERGFSTTKTYKGHVGKGNSDKTITIKSNYTNVKFDTPTNN